MAESDHRIKTVLIVGGGVAGWMAAAYLNRLLQGTDCSVTVVESVKLETSAVGMATLPSLVRFLRGLRVDEIKWMQQCSGTYKLGTRFVDWMHAGREFWHPHGLAGGTINDIDLFHFWLKSLRAGRPEMPYWSYSLQALLAERDLGPRPLRGPSPIIEAGAYGYHLDPATLADAFRELAVSEEVNHLFDDVSGVALDGAGRITHVETKAGRRLAADLFIDCTDGGELIERRLGDPWVDWSTALPCDRAVILPLPRDPRMPPYTRVTALSAGWMWHIPLSHRVACGYAYASACLPEDAALRELVSHATAQKAATGQPRWLKLRAGRRQQFWRTNCVALGPAAVAVGSLAGTDTFLVEKTLELLVACFPDDTLSPALQQLYNRRIAALCEKVRDFVLLHYLLSDRADGPFWRDSRAAPVPESLRTVIELHAENGLVEPGAVFSEGSYHCLFAAADRLPRRPLAAADAADFTRVADILQLIRNQNEEWLTKLASHAELIATIHRPLV
ncbi:MAG TPA: tryptophan halogenase family protein [Gemmataceae bacterium]|jgi:tryptophan halogenase